MRLKCFGGGLCGIVVFVLCLEIVEVWLLMFVCVDGVRMMV